MIDRLKSLTPAHDEHDVQRKTCLKDLSAAVEKTDVLEEFAEWKEKIVTSCLLTMT